MRHHCVCVVCNTFAPASDESVWFDICDACDDPWLGSYPVPSPHLHDLDDLEIADIPF